MPPSRPTSLNVRDFGAKGDGLHLDSPGINAAIAALPATGGTVRLPAGDYLSFSIRLRSNLTLLLDAGATLLAASPDETPGAYDPAEPNDWGDLHQYQDYGHSHWHNSLIWGEELENVTLAGPGLIDGRGLAHNLAYGGPRGTGPNGTLQPGTRPAIVFAPDPTEDRSPSSIAPALPSHAAAPERHGNKAIALKRCRRVTLRDFALLNGGHFALLASGVDDLTIDQLRVDTNRDGLDLDACRNVRITGCQVNSPNDDAIVLKSSYALGEARFCEDITISRCSVSGFALGSLLDGSRRPTVLHAPDLDGPTGRIKIGTESSGGFRRITISDCCFERSRGLALETVDGGVIEDVTVSNLVMRVVSNSPLFIRLGNRARGPAGTPVGGIRRIKISHVEATGVDGRFPILLAGLAGQPIEDVTLDGLKITSQGGVTLEQVAQQSSDLTNWFFLRGDEPGLTGPRDPFAVPQRERAYPEPSMFGLLPASALYARHVRNLVVRNVSWIAQRTDTRPLVVLDAVDHASIEAFTAERRDAGALVLRSSTAIETRSCTWVSDTTHTGAENIRL